MAVPSAEFMDRNQKPPNQSKCSICGRAKMTSETTQIGVCPRCDQDTSEGIVWPNDYYAWHPGMPYPGGDL